MITAKTIDRLAKKFCESMMGEGLTRIEVLLVLVTIIREMESDETARMVHHVGTLPRHIKNARRLLAMCPECFARNAKMAMEASNLSRGLKGEMNQKGSTP